jgi:nitrogen regulatory protein PII 1
MKMIRAIIRPDREAEVRRALEDAGVVGLTRLAVSGRGKQGGIQVGSAHYDDLPKVMLMVVVHATETERTVAAIQGAAFTGNFGDGIIFVTPVEAAYTIRTGSAGL